MRHPYIGLHGRLHRYPFAGSDAGKNDVTGTVAAVYQGGSITEEDGSAYCAALLLLDAPAADGRIHQEGELFRFAPDDPEEARRRLTGKEPA